MKYTLDVTNTDAFFEKIRDDKIFTCRESASGLSLRYNAVFTLISNPKINLIKRSDTQLEVNILSGPLFTVTAIAITLFFWAIGIFAIVSGKKNTALIILTFLLPSLIWILKVIFDRAVNKQIVDKLKSIIYIE